jgi:GNAT superfamily N-acetyltransferase
MSIEIREVKTLGGLKKFIGFPYKLYKKHPYWVPPLFMDEMNTLRKDKNPAFEHCEAKYWLAYRDKKIVGRIAAIINKLYIDKWKNKYARFGWIDFIDDPEVSKALLKTVESWARQKGMTAVHGPLGFTDLDYEGMLIEGFDELGTLATIYNYPYYPEHITQLGYKKDTDWMEYELPVPEEPNEKIARVAEIALRRNKLRLLNARNKKELLKYAKDLFDLIDVAYSNLYGVVPLTEKQVDAYVKQYFGFVRPEFVPVILDEKGKMVAFGVTMPSLSKALQKCRGRILPFGFIHLLNALKKNDRADLYLVAVHPDYQGKGINAVMINEMNLVYKKLGIKKAESNPELETNHLVQAQWKYFPRRQHKRRRCFIKHLK